MCLPRASMMSIEPPTNRVEENDEHVRGRTYNLQVVPCNKTKSIDAGTGIESFHTSYRAQRQGELDRFSIEREETKIWREHIKPSRLHKKVMGKSR